MRQTEIFCSIVLLICGCQSGGMSVRERPGIDYSAIALATPEDLGVTAPAAPAAVAPRKIQLPVHLAVAQLGEIAPPVEMLDALSKDHSAIADVIAVPAALNVDENYSYAYQRDITPQQRGDAQREQFRTMARKMRQFAMNQGAEYLLVFGGTIDSTTTETPLNIFDLTIVGAFVVPGKKLAAEGRAGAAMIDLQSGRVIFTLNAQTRDTRHSPSAATENDEVKQVTAMRDKLASDLTAQFKNRLHGTSSTAMK